MRSTNHRLGDPRRFYRPLLRPLPSALGPRWFGSHAKLRSPVFHRPTSTTTASGSTLQRIPPYTRCRRVSQIPGGRRAWIGLRYPRAQGPVLRRTKLTRRPSQRRLGDPFFPGAPQQISSLPTPPGRRPTHTIRAGSTTSIGSIISRTASSALPVQPPKAGSAHTTSIDVTIAISSV